jgi:hypothetical protein
VAFSFTGKSPALSLLVAELSLTLIPGHARIEFYNYANICSPNLFDRSNQLKTKAMRFGGQTA